MLGAQSPCIHRTDYQNAYCDGYHRSTTDHSDSHSPTVVINVAPSAAFGRLGRGEIRLIINFFEYQQIENFGERRTGITCDKLRLRAIQVFHQKKNKGLYLRTAALRGHIRCSGIGFVAIKREIGNYSRW